MPDRKKIAMKIVANEKKIIPLPAIIRKIRANKKKQKNRKSL
jgi:hypothetical protein